MLDAPELEELELSKQISVSPADVDRILTHPTLTAFGWYAVDVPLKQSRPVLDAIDLPTPNSLAPRDWYQKSGGLL